MIKRIAAIAVAFAMLMGSTAFAEPKAVEYQIENGVLWGYGGYAQLDVPDSVYKIGEGACMNYADLYTLNTGAYTEVIGDDAFRGSGLTAVYLGSGLKMVGSYAFADCSNLDYMYIESPDIQFGGKALVNTDYINIEIPCSSDRYRLQEEISAAKMDERFNIELVHQYSDASGKPLDHCAICGQADPEGPYANIYVPFTDVSVESWYHDYVGIAYNDGILNGKGEGKYDPDANITLGEAAKIAAVMRSQFINGDGYKLPNATTGKWYDPYVDYCYDQGIIEDYIILNWDRKATRGELAYIMSRTYLGVDEYPYYPNPDVPITDIPDVYDTTPYAYEILDLYRQGVAIGNENMYFFPSSNIKRSEVAAMVVRLKYYEYRKDLPKG